MMTLQSIPISIARSLNDLTDAAQLLPLAGGETEVAFCSPDCYTTACLGAILAGRVSLRLMRNSGDPSQNEKQ